VDLKDKHEAVLRLFPGAKKDEAKEDGNSGQPAGEDGPLL